MQTPQAKGYCLADITITDPSGYEKYIARSGPAVAAAGGRFIVRGGAPQVIEGTRDVRRVVLLEFDSVDRAKAFYESPAYQEAIPYRQAAADCHYAILTGNDPALLEPARPGAPKGYVYAEMHPTDLEKYMEYPKLSSPVAKQFGGRFIVRGGQPELKEGSRPTGRVVIVEFDSVQRAREFYFSQAYQAAMQWRLKYATSDLCLLTGVGGE